MKYRVLMFAAAAAVSAPLVAAQPAEQDVDQSRVNELRCQLTGICDETVTSEDGGIDDEATRGAGFRQLKSKAQAGATATAPVARPSRPRQNLTGTPRRPRVSGVGRPRTQPGAVEVTEEAKGSADLFVTFARNSDKLVPSARQDIKELAAVLSLPNAKGDELRLRIAGHTDATGSADFNKELSAKRAEAVRDALIAAGVKPDQLEAVGYGEEQLKNAEKPNDGINRRVEAVVID